MLGALEQQSNANRRPVDDNLFSQLEKTYGKIWKKGLDQKEINYQRETNSSLLLYLKFFLESIINNFLSN